MGADLEVRSLRTIAVEPAGQRPKAHVRIPPFRHPHGDASRYRLDHDLRLSACSQLNAAADGGRPRCLADMRQANVAALRVRVALAAAALYTKRTADAADVDIAVRPVNLDAAGDGTGLHGPKQAAELNASGNRGC